MRREEVQRFLDDFKVKLGMWGVLFRDHRSKNALAILELEISTEQRRQVLRELMVEDYSDGPLDDKLYEGASMWVFGKTIKKEEVYIKITIGAPGCEVICISFHVAEHKMKYVFK